MRKHSADVLMYLEKSKDFFTKNEESREYFFLNVQDGEKYFFEILLNIAEENFAKTGDPDINRDQFEKIREKMRYYVLKKKKEMYNEIRENTPSFFSKEYIEANILSKISVN